MSDARWIVGEFEGEYHGELAQDAPSARRTYAIRLVRGMIHQPRLVERPPASDDARGEPFRAPLLDDAVFAIGPHVDGWVRSRLVDVRIHDWTVSHQVERDGRLYGSLRGRVVAALDRPPLPPPRRELPAPPLVAPEPPPKPEAPVEEPPEPIAPVEPIVETPAADSVEAALDEHREVATPYVGCLPWAIVALILLAVLGVPSLVVVGAVLLALWALRRLPRPTAGRRASVASVVPGWRVALLLLAILFASLLVDAVRRQRSRVVAPPRLEAVPAHVSTGPAAVGCRGVPTTVAFHNVGGDALEITSLALTPEVPADFEVAFPHVPLSLGAGEHVEVPVRFAPHAGGQRRAEIVATTRDGKVTRVPLEGATVASSHVEERFVLPAAPPNDVLLVVDDSGSMAEEHQEMAANAIAFVEAAARHGADHRIGVVTTDMDAHRGRLRRFPGGRNMLTGEGDVGQAAQQLAATLRDLGTNGSADEQGLASIAAVLDADPQTFGEPFLRPDARLSIVVVSDEEDASPGSTDYYVDRLRAAKGRFNEGMVTLSAVVGDRSAGCGPVDQLPGQRYLEVQRATGGVFRSLCDPDWGQIAGMLPMAEFAPRRGFPLSRPPRDRTLHIEALRDGTRRVLRGSVDATSNVLRLDDAETVSPGDEIVVSYEARCQ